MRNKKKMIAIGGAALALIAAAAVTVSLVHRNSGDGATLDVVGDNGSKLGIGYGGHFDESANNTGMDQESDGEDYDEIGEKDDGELSEDDIEADLARVKEEAAKNREGIFYGEEGKSYGEVDLYKPKASDSSDNTTGESYSEETDEEANLNELGITIYDTKGYAENEVICDAQSMEEAESIASQISGKLLSWNNGVAIIQIEESVDEFLERLEQQGSSLELHRHYYL
ncbi:MAG: hypothetical protein J1E98_02680 [Lachnospiraceae bacterium]|nr:hypothetical protein [Lachnospiraceae bacterium]